MDYIMKSKKKINREVYRRDKDRGRDWEGEWQTHDMIQTHAGDTVHDNKDYRDKSEKNTKKE